MTETEKTRALVLMSGGLDSILAARLLMDQDIEVTAITFVTPFFGPEKGERAAKTLGIPLRIEDITERYLEMFKSPRYGFGNFMNPCIDCHSLMVRISGEIMDREGYDVIATGEVVGERPMSQTRQSLGNVARRSGYADFLLRPLSALLMTPTKPELAGKVDRDRLKRISGRSRKEQIAMAEHYGITGYPQPASGCLLTDPNYSGRLAELLLHEPSPSRRDFDLLRIGRHFRLPDKRKIIVSRNEDESEKFFAEKESDDILISLDPLPGPVALITSGASSHIESLAAGICRYYSKYRKIPVSASVVKQEQTTTIDAPELSNEDFRPFLIDHKGRH